MSDDATSTITRLLRQAHDGDAAALGALFPLVYGELRGLAHRRRGFGYGNATLNTTALVHEAYLKLVDQGQAAGTSRAHFFAIAAQAMRHILIDYARGRRAAKRGGDAHDLPLDAVEATLGIDLNDRQIDTLLDLDAALAGLAEHSPRQHRIVECRFFAGMTIDETATALALSPATVKRGWTMAQAWLHRALREDEAGQG